MRQDFPRNTTGNCQAAHPLTLGLGPMPSPNLCLFCWGRGVPVNVLGSLRVWCTQYRLALRYSFQCFLGFLFVSWGLGTLCFRFSLPSSFKEHLSHSCLYLITQLAPGPLKSWSPAKWRPCVGMGNTEQFIGASNSNHEILAKLCAVRAIS